MLDRALRHCGCPEGAQSLITSSLRLEHYDLIKKGKDWVLERRGSYRPIVAAQTKEEALSRTERYMRQRMGLLHVYDEDGKVVEERVY